MPADGGMGSDAGGPDAAPAEDAGGPDSSSAQDGGTNDAGSPPDAGSSAECGDGTRPGPDNTGPTDESALTPMGGTTITTEGAVYEDVLFEGGVTIEADDVVLRNFRIEAGGAWYGVKATNGNTGIVLESGEITGARSSGVFGGGFTARCLNVHEHGGDGFKTTRDVLVESSWIHHLGTNDGAHADGNQTRGGSNITFRGNFCDMPVSDPDPYKSNACFMLQEPDSSPIDDFVIEDNWLDGGNYTVYCAGDTHVLDNRFGRNFRYGTHNGDCAEWTGNVWADTGEPVQ
jgi:hypothetical protein